jgi:hypothetical protein
VKTSAVCFGLGVEIGRGRTQFRFTRGENFCGSLQIKSGDWIYVEGQSSGLREVKTSAVISN